MKREWLIERRQGRQLTQAEVAEQVHISRAHYTQIEAGRRRPSPELAIRLGELLSFEWTRFFHKTL